MQTRTPQVTIAADVARVKRWTALANARRQEIKAAFNAAVAAVTEQNLPVRTMQDRVLEAMESVLRDPRLVLRNRLVRRYSRRALASLAVAAMSHGASQPTDASGLPVTLERAQVGDAHGWVGRPGRSQHAAVVAEIPGGLPCPWCGGAGVELGESWVVVCERDPAHVFAWVPWGG